MLEAVAQYRPVPLVFERLPAEESVARSRGFLDLVRSRRSVRRFSREPVPPELVENAVAAAGTAPSGANLQPWTFVIISDADVKERIREAAEEAERDFYERLAPADWLEALRPLGTDFAKEHLTDAPYLIAVFEQAYGTDSAGRKRKHYYAKESVGIAVGLLLASLHAAGLVALTHTPSPMGYLRRILERPRNERPFVLIPVGYPAEDCEVPDIARKPLDEILVRL
jgi:iodotyrosine deiodinase